jgi:hypothetical protein
MTYYCHLMSVTIKTLYVSTKEALIKDAVHVCDWDFAQNRGKRFV